MRKLKPDDIDAILPQTQCGLCGHGGCMPYAKAIVERNAPINLCPPGGIPILKQLAELTEQDPEPYLEDMADKAKPALVAMIRENECIGCMKCIAACPVDAIIGGPKLMHTIVANECSGCELCVSPCPVDCIDMIEIPAPASSKAAQYRARYERHQMRIERRESKPSPTINTTTLDEKKSYLQAALARVKASKQNT
jgi:electron transport complex protein RnfB